MKAFLVSFTLVLFLSYITTIIYISTDNTTLKGKSLIHYKEVYISLPEEINLATSQDTLSCHMNKTNDTLIVEFNNYKNK
jgi:hypothetical protein